MGLVAAGGVARSFLARMPALLARLGPIKAASYRVARRLVNQLKSGRAASHYSMLEPCPVILVCVPEEHLSTVMLDMRAQIPLRQNIVVLCGCVRGSLSAGALRAAGARVASLNAVDQTGERVFVAEGHPEALRALRSLLAAEQRKLVEIRAEAKSLYWAGVNLASQLLIPWFAASVESLCAAGLSRAEAASMTQALGAAALRQWAKAGRKAWRGLSDPTLGHILEPETGSLQAADPRIAALYTDMLRQALEYFKEP